MTNDRLPTSEGPHNRWPFVSRRRYEAMVKRAEGTRRFIRKLSDAKRQETNRARAAEDILRHWERLTRNDPNYQRIREEAGAHLAKYRDYVQIAPDTLLVSEEVK